MQNVIGIIAEYNPFHNGHAFMMNEAKARFKDAACVVVLGSNFTQRGEPALIDKFMRAETALKCGADLVLELPFFFSCAAAPDFSAGAVDILAKTKLATHIAFGMEDINYKNLGSVINILSDEPASFKENLKKYLSEGMSYTKAVSQAVNNIISDGESFLSSPNNMLAISYLTRIKKFNYKLTPIFISRTGMAHSDIFNFKALHPSVAFGDTSKHVLKPKGEPSSCFMTSTNHFASSGAIRTALIDNNLNNLKNFMPEFSLKILNSAIAEGRIYFNHNQKLWRLLQAFLMRTPAQELRNYDGINNGLENLFLKHWRDSENLEDFVNKCVSARYTRSYIRRCLIRALIGVNKFDAFAIRRLGVPYARVLGFNKTGRELLKKFRYKSELKFITRLAAANSENSYLTKYEFIASDLYEMLLDNQDLYHEVRHKPIFI